MFDEPPGLSSNLEPDAVPPIAVTCPLSILRRAALAIGQQTPFSGNPRHVRRIGMVSDYERERHRPAGGLPTHTEV